MFFKDSSLVPQLAIKKNFDNIKMHDMYAKIMRQSVFTARYQLINFYAIYTAC